MCRMLAMVARGDAVKNIVPELIDAFYRASRDDPYLASITGGDGRHCHGYGFVLAARTSGGWMLSYERFDAANDLGVGEESCRVNLEELGKACSRIKRVVSSADQVVLVLHSRRAGRQEPRGVQHAHPYHYCMGLRGGAVDIFLAHNGSVDKESLARIVGLDPSSYTDSNILLLWMASQIRYGVSFKEAIISAKSYTKPGRGLDLAILTISPGLGLDLYLVGYVAPEPDDKRRRYYETFIVRSDDIIAMVSSTIKDYASSLGLDFKSLYGRAVHVDARRVRIVEEWDMV